MRISDWSSTCALPISAVGAGFGIALAADIRIAAPSTNFLVGAVKIGLSAGECGISYHLPRLIGAGRAFEIMLRSEEHTPELQSLMRISYAVFCLKKKNNIKLQQN